MALIQFDLGDDATLLRPASRLTGKVRIGTPDINGGTTNRAFEEVADPFPARRSIGGKPDGVVDPFAFKVLVDIRAGEARAGAKIDARDLAAIARQDWL